MVGKKRKNIRVHDSYNKPQVIAGLQKGRICYSSKLSAGQSSTARLLVAVRKFCCLGMWWYQLQQ
jgi:hypothetical protein